MCAGRTVGAIAIHRPDPVMFLGYWNREEATREKFVGDWLVTGDLGRKDEDGFFWYVGRDDDVITSGGYRIGPAEVEECLIRHPAVALAAVIGVSGPDPDGDRQGLRRAARRGGAVRRSWPARSRNSSRSGWRRTSTRARWRSSPNCR